MSRAVQDGGRSSRGGWLVLLAILCLRAAPLIMIEHVQKRIKATSLLHFGEECSKQDA